MQGRAPPEDLVLIEGLQSQGVTARNFAYSNVAFILPSFMVGNGEV